MSGWSRLIILANIAWSLSISVWAYLEYPTGGEFGGIPVGPFRFWTVIEGMFNPSDQAGLLPGAYEIAPNYQSFVVYGLVPIILSWFLYFGSIWVKKGFTSRK